MTKAKRHVDMCEGPIFTNMLRFLLPLMLTALIQKFYNAADSIVVGRAAGEAALAGVGVTGSISTLILNLFLGGSAGVSVVLGRAIGAGSKTEISRIVHTAFCISVTFGTAIALIGVLFAEPLLMLIKVNAEIMPHAKIYMQIIFAGKVPAMIYNFGAGMLRAKGDSKRPLYIITVSAILNIILNLVFVVLFQMGAAGVGLATVLAQLYSAVAVLYRFINDDGDTRFYVRKLRFHKTEFFEIMKVGIPAGLQSVLTSFANVMIQSSVNTFSTAAIAGSSAAASVGTFYYSAVHSVFLATGPFVSRNVGAKKYDRIKKIIGSAMLFATFIGIIETIITLLFGKALIGIYQPGNTEAIENGYIRLIIVGCTYAVCGYMETINAALRSLGYSFVGMMSSAIGMCGIRSLWVVTVFAAVGTFESLFICFPISWLVTFIFNSIMFLLVFHRFKKKNEALSEV